MGLLLKIALLGVALYAVWKTFSRWKGLFDRFVGRPDEPPTPPPQPKPAPRAVAVEDTQRCPVCGAFVAAGSGKCGQPNCPLP